jgi:hypothetical protein
MNKQEKISFKIIRDGSESRDEGWKRLSPSERIEAVWTLTKLCMEWNNPGSNEPRLQRTITRLQRGVR